MKKVGSMFSRMLWFLAAVLVVYQVCLPTLPSTTIAGADRQADQPPAGQSGQTHLSGYSNQLALSEDAEALVYVTTGSDIYTQSEAVQHGLNDAKPYPIWRGHRPRTERGYAKVSG